MTPEHRRSLWLSLSLGGREGRVLLLDAHDPGRLAEAGGLNDLSALPPDAIVVIDGAGFEFTEAAGRLLVTRGFLWSVLDPRRAGSAYRLALSDRLAAEGDLRTEGAILWDGVKRWAALDAGLREDVRRLLTSASGAAGVLLTVIDELSTAAGANPFAGWAALPEPPGRPVSEPLPVPLDPMDLGDWLLSPEGLGAVRSGTFQPREAQAAMGRDVAEALRTGTPLLIEAGTGVGKSMAYLAPLLASLQATDSRGIVSTHTRALQSQLLGTDLPRLGPLFPELKYRLLMGRSNYLCRTRELRFLERPVQGRDDAWSAASFRLWLAHTTEGLREEVQDHPALRRHLTEIFDSPEPCSPSICQGQPECHVQRARRLAREARLVVVNHSLMMFDFAAGHLLVGEYDKVVVDEAHRLPAAALDAFEICCDTARALVMEELLGAAARGNTLPAAARAVARSLENGGESCREALPLLAEVATAQLAVLAAYRRWLTALAGRFDVLTGVAARFPGRLRVREKEEVFGPVSPSTLALLDACSDVDRIWARFAGALEQAPLLPEGLDEELATLARVMEMLGELERNVTFLVGEEDPDWVVWLDPDRDGAFRAVGATQLEAGRLLGALWRKDELNPVLTSGTLGIGEDFGHMARELGLHGLGRPLIESLIPSPFDHVGRTRFLTTPAFPAPDSARWQPAVADLVRRLVRRTLRKTLVLFTSHAALQGVAAILRGEGDGPGSLRLEAGWGSVEPVILSQGSAPPAELMQRFRRERHAILLGTNTFWEGVDLPGEELEQVVVTKLPFLVPSDPWVSARCDLIEARGENPFVDFMVRDAVLRLRQGIGRLLRSPEDQGVVVLLDSRLHTKPYGMTFLHAMPTTVDFCAGPEEIVSEAAAFFERT